MRSRLSSALRRALLGLTVAGAGLAAACSGPDTSGVFGGDAGSAGSAGGASPGASSTSTESSTSSTSGPGATGTSSTSAGGAGPGGAGPGGGVGATCGDGVAQGSEACDGQDLGGATCESLGKSTGVLQCGPGCAFDTAGCGSTCGDGVLDAGEACDDGDGEDLNGCSNACAARGRACGEAIPVALALGTRTIEGTTEGGGDHEAKAAQTCEDTSGPDLVYAITPAAAGFLTARLVRGEGSAATDYDSVLYARSSCESDDGQLLCADSFDPETENGLPGGELVSFRVQAGSPVFLFVDGYEGAKGRYLLELDLSTGADCADPVPIAIAPGSSMTLTGGTLGLKNDAKASCSAANAPDVVYAIRRTSAGPLHVELESASFDAALFVQATCGGEALACSEMGGGGGEELTASPSAGVDFFYWVDAAVNNVGGPYRLVVRP